MTTFLLRRLVQAAVVVFIVVTLTFFLIRLAPGDPFANRFEIPVPQDVLEEYRARWGLDKPLIVQYGHFVTNVARGDFGQSFRSQQPVLQQLRTPLFNTVLLGLTAFIINFSIGIGVGVFQARRHDRGTDRATTAAAFLLLSLPMFWLAVLASQLFGGVLDLFPQFGVTRPVGYEQLSLVGKLLDRLHHLILPASVLGVTGAAITSRYMRGQAVDMAALPHVMTARAKGLPEAITFSRHVVRNALLPMVTLAGLTLPALLSGAVFIETVFAWNGLGYEATVAARDHDYPIITGVTAMVSVLVVLASIVADSLYRVVDPRVRIT